LTATRPPISIPPRTGPWQYATVEKITVETYRVKTFTLRLDQWRPFHAGQHYDVRLTAPDGYQAQRSYSVASAPEAEGTIDLTIEMIPEGEVSPYFHEVVEPGDRIEVRGPIGGPFTWTRDLGGPLFLAAGGSGIVPIMSMLRHRSNVAPEIPAQLLYSSRSWEDIIYREELDRRAAEERLEVVHTLTRARPPGWTGYSRRIDRPMLKEALGRVEGVPLSYVCGPTPLVEAVADELVVLGVPPEKVRTERFGPTGG
jgi:ferredoxin-NADP reductase